MNPPYHKRKDKSGLVAEFRITVLYPYYIKVYLWSSPIYMVQNISSDDPAWESGRCIACYLSMESKKLSGENVIPHFFGEMHFGKMPTARVVSHEMMHMLLDFIVSLEIEDEEKICIIAGNVNERFWTKFYKLAIERNNSTV